MLTGSRLRLRGSPDAQCCVGQVSASKGLKRVKKVSFGKAGSLSSRGCENYVTERPSELGYRTITADG